MISAELFLRSVRKSIEMDVHGRYERADCFAHLRGIESIISVITVDNLGDNATFIYASAEKYQEEATVEAQYLYDHPEIFEEADPMDRDAEDGANPEFWEGKAEAWQLVMNACFID